jgi:peptide/nickel transport system substrate-binding protein
VSNTPGCGKKFTARPRKGIPQPIRRPLARLFLALCAVFGAAATPVAAEQRHGIAMHGEPKYPPDFQHFDYVNPSAPKGGDLVMAVLGSFDSTNPLIIKGAPVAGVREYVQESLLARSYDEPFTLYGLLAETVETPPDRSSVTFTLNPLARFSDGAPVTPDDVIFSWSLLKESGRPNHRTYYSKVKAVTRVGERGVRFDFEADCDREMPLIMGLMPVLPKHATAPDEFEKTSFQPPIGSGPYIIEAVHPGSSITYRRNPDYWGRDLPVNRGQHNFASIRFDYYRDTNAMMEAFRKGLFHIQGESDPGRWITDYDFPAIRDGRVKKHEFDIAVPAGMTAFVFNTRRPVFQDIRVREALTLLFDFEWVNRNLFHGLYVRTQSYFDRSELSSHGKPADARERQLLAPFEAGLLPGMMEGAFAQPQTDGSGTNRDGRRRALALLQEAGFALRDGQMVNAATGEPLRFEMLTSTREQERLMLNFARSLRQAGIVADVRQIDSAQFQRRRTSFEFDIIQMTWPASLSPGNEQLFRWSRDAADQEGSFNFAGVRSEAADAMIAALLAAETREDFVSAVRALDRVLLSGRYVIPLFHLPKQWVATWSHLKQPERSTLYGFRVETWWAGPQQADALR